MITIELTPATEQRLRNDAEVRGISTEQHARELLEGILSPRRTAGQELVEELERDGVLGAWAGRAESEDAQAYARLLRARADQRTRE